MDIPADPQRSRLLMTTPPVAVNAPRERIVRSIDRALLVAFVLVGLLLRVPGLSTGLWRDEVSTVTNASRPGPRAVIAGVRATELNPPGYFLFMHAWTRVVGAGEVSLKVPSLLFGLALIVANYGLGRAVGSRATGLMAAALTAVAPEAIWASQEARPYPLEGLLAALAALYLSRAMGPRGSKFDLAALAACAAGLLYVHYTGLVFLGALVLAAWSYRAGDRPRGLVRATAAIGLAFVLFLPWVPTFLVHLREGTIGADPDSVPSSWRRLAEQLLDETTRGLRLTVPAGARAWFAGLPLDRLFGLALKAAVVAWAGRAVVVSLRRRASAPTGAGAEPGGGWLGLASLIGVVAAALLKKVSPRYLLPFSVIAWPFFAYCCFCLVPPAVLRRFRAPRPRALATAALAAIFVAFSAGIMRSQSSSAAPRDKSALRAIAREAPNPLDGGALVLIGPEYYAPTYYYYDTRLRKGPIHGFIRWDHPELFDPYGLAAKWADPGAVAAALVRVRDAARRGAHRLAFVVGYDPPHAIFRDYPMEERTAELLVELERNYKLLWSRSYDGSSEKARLFMFDLDRDGVSAPASGADTLPDASKGEGAR
jgi:4-amino-4-deoxy-L-arabinose transferase-like glycosyltransferase